MTGLSLNRLQVVYHDKMKNFSEISRLNVGAAIIVTGTLVATPRQNSRLRSRQRRLRLKEHLHRSIHCRRNAILLSICARSRICGQGQIHSRLYSVCAPCVRMRSINFFRREDLCMYTHRSSQAVTAKVQARCSR